MNPKYPIYIPSKGRASSCLTMRVLSGIGVDYRVVVEPQDKREYQKTICSDKILVLPFSNLGMGSTPARNWIMNHSKNNGEDRHWIIDDNIECFNRLNKNRKPPVTSGNIFKAAEDFTNRYENIALSGFNYYSFCKSTDRIPAYYLNTRIYSCTLINNRIPFKWRGRYNEDTDLSLRVLKSGWCTVLFNAFLAGKVTTQRMRGGNTDNVYTDNDERREFAESLQRQHPDVVRVVRKFGRWHHQVNYKPFKRNKLIRKDGIKVTQGVNNYGMKLMLNNKGLTQ